MEKEKECKWKYKVESKSCAAIKVREKKIMCCNKSEKPEKKFKIKVSCQLDP